MREPRIRPWPRWAVLCAGWMTMATAEPAEFHVCDCASGAAPACVAGDDAAVGSAAAPWRSYERGRAAFASLAAGDAVLFCRGGAWDINGAGERWVNGQCQPAQRCRIGAYLPTGGAADAPKPLLRRLDGDDGFSLADGGSAEQEAGYRIEGLALQSTTQLGNGIFLQNDVDDVVISDVRIDGFYIGVYLAGSNACSADPDCDGRNERIVLEDSELTNNHFSGWLGASNDSMILNSLFVGNGTNETFDHNVYLSDTAGSPVSGMRVIGNRLYQAALDAQGVCRAVSLVVHGVHDDLLIEGNEVWEDVGQVAGGCWGIAVDPGYGSDPEAFTQIVIRGNVVRNVGNQAIGVASCSQCTIENNLIIQEQPASSFRSVGIAAPNRQRQSNDLPLDAVRIRNNSIWFGPASGGTGIRLGGEGDEHLLASNVVVAAGGAAFDCFELDTDPLAYLDSDHNQCFAPSAAPFEWADDVGSLAQWQTLTGLDGQSEQLDPGYTDPAAYDLRPATATVSMVDRGHPLHSSSSDYLGHARDAAPDRGAFEWLGEALHVDGFETDAPR